MQSSSRVTQQDIATRAGLNRATISLALRNHPSIAHATKKRVQALADEMGYRPDPMLSALAAYRNSRHSPEFRGSLGWLATTTTKFKWREKDPFVRYLAGAEQQADKLGYRVQVIDLGEHGIRWERAASVARAQGIQGLMFCPQPDPDTKLPAFPWHTFSAVTFGDSISEPRIAAVAPAQFRAALQSVAELRARGYRRIGFIGRRSHDEVTGHHYFGGYLSGVAFDHWQNLLPPYWLETEGEEKLEEWIERYQPDAVVISMEYFYQILLKRGFVGPRDFGVVCPGTGHTPYSVSGIAEVNERIGTVAVDMLVGMIQRGEKGIPPHAQRLLVEGTWVEGTTVRPRLSRTELEVCRGEDRSEDVGGEDGLV